MTTELMTAVEVEEKTFALAQRKAKVYSESSLVPQQYQKNVGNVLIAQNMASRMGADPLMVMQNLYIVHGKPGWSAQFLIACFNSCGRFSAIKYRLDGQGDDYGCTAYATEHDSGEIVEGVRVTMGMAKAEGWSTKAGSKWKTMPDLMLRYRAATFLIRCTAPEIGLGLQTAEEIRDTVDGNVRASRAEPIKTDDLTAILAPQAKPEGERDYQAEIDAAATPEALRAIRGDLVRDEGNDDAGVLITEIDDRIAMLETEMQS